MSEPGTVSVQFTKGRPAPFEEECGGTSVTRGCRRQYRPKATPDWARDPRLKKLVEAWSPSFPRKLVIVVCGRLDALSAALGREANRIVEPDTEPASIHLL